MMDMLPLLVVCNKKSLGAGGLLLMVVCSGFAVSYTAYESRRLHNQLQQVLEDRNKAQVNWGRLLLEHGTLTSPGKVERLAREKLNMVVPRPDNIEMVMQ